MEPGHDAPLALVQQSQRGLSPLDDAALRGFARLLRAVNLRSGEHLTQPGREQHVVGIVATGLIGLQYLGADGTQLTKFFFTPRCWLTSGLSWNSPSSISLRALAPTQVWVADAACVSRLQREHPTLTKACQVLLAQHLEAKQRREIELLTLTATDRYLRFLAMFASVQHEISQAQVAGYIGVTPTQLSRIRQQLGLSRARSS